MPSARAPRRRSPPPLLPYDCRAPAPSAANLPPAAHLLAVGMTAMYDVLWAALLLTPLLAAGQDGESWCSFSPPPSLAAHHS